MKNFILPVLILFLSACSIKNYNHTQTKIIIIKSPKIRFGDIGYLRNSSKAVELEMFEAGKVIGTITINHLVCINSVCMTKSKFNKDYLNIHYPDDILQNILLANKIYNAQNIIQTKNGFEQKIDNKYVQIIYKVTPRIIYFKDKLNKIILKIKDINE